MGLDMYVRKAKKVTDAQRQFCEGQNADNIRDLGFEVYELEDGKLPDLIKHLNQYGKIINYEQTLIDVKRLLRENDIPEDAECCGRAIGPEGYSWFFNDKEGNHLEIKKSNEELKPYLYPQTFKGLLVKWDGEVYYWRKAYDVDNAICNACTTLVENCGYYRLTQKMLQAIRKYDKRAYDAISANMKELGDDEQLFYHNWY